MHAEAAATLTLLGDVVHAGDMAIRMKEWGMQHTPESPVRIPLEGMHGWIEAAEKLGGGAASAVLGATELLRAEQQVTAGGELAAFSERLQRIGDETAAELADRKVEDWEYTWREVSSPRIAEAVAALPPQARLAGQELAAAYNAQASLRAQRDCKVQSIQRARHHWQQRVDDAVRSGDAERAEQWLQSGAGVFVPATEIDQQKEQAGSKACVSRWQGALRADPWQALADYRAAKPEQLPSVQSDFTQLAEQMKIQQRASRRALAQAMVQGSVYSEADRECAVAAGLLTEEESTRAATSPHAFSVAEICDWNRRIDECMEEDSAKTDLLMSLATAPMQQDLRQRLLARLQMSERVAASDRRVMSRRLLRWYAEGGFGCPQDTMAQQRLHELQEAGLPLLAEQGSAAVAEWLQGIGAQCDAWVCFSDLA